MKRAPSRSGRFLSRASGLALSPGYVTAKIDSTFQVEDPGQMNKVRFGIVGSTMLMGISGVRGHSPDATSSPSPLDSTERPYAAILSISALSQSVRNAQASRCVWK